MRICVQVSKTEIKDVSILYGSKNVLITSEISYIFFQEISCQDFTSILALLVKLIIYHEGKKINKFLVWSVCCFTFRLLRQRNFLEMFDRTNCYCPFY